MHLSHKNLFSYLLFIDRDKAGAFISDQWRRNRLFSMGDGMILDILGTFMFFLILFFHKCLWNQASVKLILQSFVIRRFNISMEFNKYLKCISFVLIIFKLSHKTGDLIEMVVGDWALYECLTVSICCFGLLFFEWIAGHNIINQLHNK